MPQPTPKPPRPETCWCGGRDLQIWGEGYWRCDDCQTLVAGGPVERQDRVDEDEAGLYGRDYWYSRQQSFGFGSIEERARTDMAERCIHWLRSLLQWKLPPGRVVEVGCAHGGFVALMRQAGFDASGLELSPAIVDLARRTFHVPVERGTLEEQPIPERSLDAIVMMDVLEHLPDPLATLRRAAKLLKDDGLLLIQTPSYPENADLATLRRQDHRFLTMLDLQEHLFLFSRMSVARLLEAAGVAQVRFISAIFPANDMAVVASPRPLKETPAEERDRLLLANVQGRMLLALLDLDDRRLSLLAKFRELRDSVAKPRC